MTTAANPRTGGAAPTRFHPAAAAPPRKTSQTQNTSNVSSKLAFVMFFRFHAFFFFFFGARSQQTPDDKRTVGGVGSCLLPRNTGSVVCKDSHQMLREAVATRDTVTVQDPSHAPDLLPSRTASSPLEKAAASLTHSLTHCQAQQSHFLSFPVQGGK